MAKKTEYIDVHGKVKYIHAVTMNKYGNWSVTLCPDETSLNIIRDLQGQGLKNVVKKDDDGYYVNFNRETSKQMRGKLVAFAAPPVVVKTDTGTAPMDGNRIGWGSDVTVRLEVRWYKPPNGTNVVPAARWHSLRVDNLVPYDPDKSIKDEDEREAFKAISNAKEPEPW